MQHRVVCSLAVLFFVHLSVFSQNNQSINLSAPVLNSNAESKWIPLLIHECEYDAQFDFIPYYTVSGPEDSKIEYNAVLENEVYAPLSAEISAVLNLKYSSWIEASARLRTHSGKSQNRIMSQVHIIPFRKTNSGQFEYLKSFNCRWKPTLNAKSSQAASTFTTRSVLSEGSWIKIGIANSGVYKIDYAMIQRYGINPKTVNPKNVRVFGNGGEMLAEQNNAFRYDDVNETPAVFYGNSNSEWEPDEFLYFYGIGSIRWNVKSLAHLKFEAQKNLYSDSSFYFVQIGTNNRKLPDSLEALSPFTPSYTTDTYDYYAHMEDNIVNLGKTGRAFYGNYFDVENTYTIPFLDGPYSNGDSITIACALAGLSRETAAFNVTSQSVNGTLRTRGLRVGEMYEDYASDTLKIFKGKITNTGNLAVTVSKITTKAVGWLDYITVHARRQLVFSGTPMAFRDIRGAGEVTQFNIRIPIGSKPCIWNVTQRHAVKIQNYTFTSSSSIRFEAKQDSLNEYIIFIPTNLNSPAFVNRITPQNLHAVTGAEYIIIYHPLFKSEAETLGALHFNKDGLTYVTASTEAIYNEFSSGNTDASAIRDFIRMVYTRSANTNKPTKYVLLMGDGSYNNKSKNIINNSALIPTYQSLNSLSQTQSIATDDFFGLMDATEGYNAENNGLGKIDIGVGRLTCKTKTEIQQVLQKIIRHYDAPEPVNVNIPNACYGASENKRGDWRTWLLFLGDDEDNALHMNQANQLAESIRLNHPEFNFDKIFLDAYQRISTPGGGRYPDASADFVNRIKKGTLVFNYTGHGGEVGLTAERLIDLNTINQMDNKNRMPLFITATCEFSRYDDPARTSAGELCLLHTNGAAIALLSTCRVAFSSTNYILNATLLNALFTRNATGQWPRLGDVIRETKARLGQNFTYANFHLLGDPALTLHYPQYQILTSAVNGKTLSVSSRDTLGALQKVSISGKIVNTEGTILNQYNGLVYTTVFDREKKINCLVNTPESALYVDTLGSFMPFSFVSQKNVLYRGKAQVKNGLFSFNFIVPKDIAIDAGPGKISYYATDGISDASGSEQRLMVGGKPVANLNDNTGPRLQLFMNDINFVNGGITHSNPILGVLLEDSSGINISGNGIGHDIVAILDYEKNKPLVLNDYYEADVDRYQSGQIRYPLTNLKEGSHHISIKAWDIQNNSSEAELDFIVAQNSVLALKHVLNYPNPFTTHTRFMFEHNQACQPLYVQIDIFTVSGKRVKTLRDQVLCNGFRYEGIEWDGRDDFGDRMGKGVYLYKLRIQNAALEKAEQIEKLVILN